MKEKNDTNQKFNWKSIACNLITYAINVYNNLVELMNTKYTVSTRIMNPIAFLLWWIICVISQVYERKFTTVVHIFLQIFSFYSGPSLIWSNEHIWLFEGPDSDAVSLEYIDRKTFITKLKHMLTAQGTLHIFLCHYLGKLYSLKLT